MDAPPPHRTSLCSLIGCWKLLGKPFMIIQKFKSAITKCPMIDNTAILFLLRWQTMFYVQWVKRSLKKIFPLYISNKSLILFLFPNDIKTGQVISNYKPITVPSRFLQRVRTTDLQTNCLPRIQKDCRWKSTWLSDKKFTHIRIQLFYELVTNFTEAGE